MFDLLLAAEKTVEKLFRLNLPSPLDFLEVQHPIRPHVEPALQIPRHLFLNFRRRS